VGTIDLTHAAGTKRRPDFVRSEASSGRKHHIDLSDFTPADRFAADLPDKNALFADWTNRLLWFSQTPR
jgi:hypothetical protein